MSINFKLIMQFFWNNIFIIHITALDASFSLYSFLCIVHLPDEDWSEQQKHIIVYNKILFS